MLQHTSMVACAMHDGRNQWVWSLVRLTIKRKILVDQGIKGYFKAGSSDHSGLLRQPQLMIVQRLVKSLY